MGKEGVLPQTKEKDVKVTVWILSLQRRDESEGRSGKGQSDCDQESTGSLRLDLLTMPRNALSGQIPPVEESRRNFSTPTFLLKMSRHLKIPLSFISFLEVGTDILSVSPVEPKPVSSS